MTSLRVRTAGPDDAESVALLHADSWRRHYRGAYSDSFLDGDIAADRRCVWTARLAARSSGSTTVLAEDGTGLVGFVHVVFDDDPRWGSLVDNLHVTHHRRGTGVGSLLLTRAARAVAQRPAGGPLYLWVLEQNTAAQGFYLSLGATRVEKQAVPPPGGVPARLNGSPARLRFAWPAAALPAPAAPSPAAPRGDG